MGAFGGVEMRNCAAFIAAERKCPLDTRVERGVSGEGCEEEIRKGGGTSRSVKGW
jgi:hypothetical protein